MKKITFLFMILTFFSCFNIFGQIKVACIGNSITYGDGIEDREKNSYPAQMQQLLGNEWETKNFGVNGATLLKKGDKPYWNQPEFSQAKDFNPDVVIIKLGTNDTKPENWKHNRDFVVDYLDMIEVFRELPSKPLIFICLPVPAYEIKWGIRNELIDNYVIPYVKDTKKKAKVNLIDLNTPLTNHPELFPDNIHPSKEGAWLIAKEISSVLNKDKNKILKRNKNTKQNKDKAKGKGKEKEKGKDKADKSKGKAKGKDKSKEEDNDDKHEENDNE